MLQRGWQLDIESLRRAGLQCDARQQRSVLMVGNRQLRRFGARLRQNPVLNRLSDQFAPDDDEELYPVGLRMGVLNVEPKAGGSCRHQLWKDRARHPPFDRMSLHVGLAICA